MALVTRELQPDHAGRVERLRQHMAEANVDGVYFSAGMNMFYFLGSRDTAGDGRSGLPAQSSLATVKSSLSATRMHRDIAAHGQTLPAQLRTHRDGDDVLPIMEDILGDAGVRGGRLGIEASLWSTERSLLVQAAPASQLVDFQAPIDALRW